MEKKVTRNNGSLKISNEVIMKISELAATEIIGVATDGDKLVVQESTISIANKFISPVKISINGDSAVIGISIIVRQGHKAINVANAVQNSVKSAVQNMTGIAVSKVNVKIVGIELTKEQ